MRNDGTNARARSWSLAALIAALSMVGPFSIDMYLPALPSIGTALAAPSIAVQQTLSIYLFAYALMMLWHGALSDALGRRPIVLGGLAVFAVATLGCAIAGNIESLWLFRAMQGACAGTGLVVGRALIRDRFHGAEAQKLMSQITLVFGIAPVVAPIAGGLLLTAFGWRAIFWALLVFTLAVLAWAARSMPETLPPHARHSLAPRALWHNYKTVLSRADYLLLAFIPALNFAAFFVYIAAAPAFLIDLLGVTARGFAWLFVPMIAGIMLGAAISGRLAGRRSPQQTVRFAYAIMFAGAGAGLAASGFAPRHVAWHVLPIMIYTTGSALMMPSITLMMLDLFPSMRGLASSLQGFIHFLLSAFNAATIAPGLAHSLPTLAAGMAVFTVASFALWRVYERRVRPVTRETT
jgi:DHA1 family bicyclomycin/chloramphenicol resistance-like MFS transporter